MEKLHTPSGLTYNGIASGTLTRHNFFAPTLCPGPFLQVRFPQITTKVNEKLNKEDEEDMTQRFNTLAEIPEWFRSTIQKLADPNGAAIIRGSGVTDENGFPADMNLSEDMIRILVMNDRAGLYSQ